MYKFYIYYLITRQEYIVRLDFYFILVPGEGPILPDIPRKYTVDGVIIIYRNFFSIGIQNRVYLINVYCCEGQIENGPVHDRRRHDGARRSHNGLVGHAQIRGHEDIVSVGRRAEKSRAGRTAAQRPPNTVLRRDHDRPGQLFGRARRQHTEERRPDRQDRRVHDPPARVRRVRQVRRRRPADRRTASVPGARHHGQSAVPKVSAPSRRR